MPPDGDQDKDKDKNGGNKPPESSSKPDDGSAAEISKLTDQLASKTTEVETLTGQVTTLTDANKRFADDAGKLPEITQERDSLRGQVTTLAEEKGALTNSLDEERAKAKTAEETVLTSRKAALVKNYGIPEDKVNGLTATQLDAVEATVSSVKPSQSNGTDGKGLDLTGDGGGTSAVAEMTESQRALKTIVDLKTKK